MSIPTTCLAVGIALGLPCWAEDGFVLVQVQDAQHHPVRGVKIGIDGFGGSKLTGDDGKAKLSVGSGARENDWISGGCEHYGLASCDGASHGKALRSH